MYSLDESVDVHGNKYLDVTGERDDIYIKEVLSSNENVEDEAITNFFISEVLNYIENRFSDIDLDIFKESFGLVDRVPKSHIQLGQKYGFSDKASSHRYRKVLRNVKQKFQI